MSFLKTIIVVQNNLDPNTKSHVQRFSHFEIPIKYQYFIDIKISIPIAKLFDINIDVD